MRSIHAGLVAALAVLLGARGAVSDGTVDVSGATLAVGAAPVAGIVEVSPGLRGVLAPNVSDLPAPPVMEEMTGTGNPFPGTSGPFHATADVTLPGGTYDVTTYAVDAGVTVTYAGPVTFRATGVMTIHGVVRAAGSLDAIADGDVEVLGGLSADAGVALRSRSGGLRLGATSSVSADVVGSVWAEAAGEVRVEGAVTCNTGWIRIASFGDSTSLTGGAAIEAVAGRILVRARDSVTVTGGARVAANEDAVELIAYEGAVRLGVDATGAPGAATITTDAEDVEIRGRSLVWMGGEASIDASALLRVLVYEGDYRQTGDASVTGGHVHVWASGGLLAESSGTASITGTEPHAYLALTGNEALTLDVPIVRAGNAATGPDGRIGAGSRGPVRIRGTLEAGWYVEVFSLEQGVDVAGATIRTFDADAGESGDITVESWNEEGGVVDARGAVLRTGDSPQRSGDITVGVRLTSSTYHKKEDGYLLPRKVKAKLRLDRPERSKLTAKGVLDLGSGTATDLSRPGTLTVGSLVFDLPGLSRSGRTYRHDDGTLKLKLRAPADATSGGSFELRLRRDLAGIVDPDGELEIAYVTGDLEARTVVLLADGRFRRGGDRGDLHRPLLWVEDASIRQDTVAPEKLRLDMGIATEGPVPDAIGDVRIACESFETTIPGSEFTRRGDRFEWEGDSRGITRVVFDHARGEVRVRGGRLPGLGGFGDGPRAVTFSFDVGPDWRAVVVTMKKRRHKLRY